MCNTEHDPHNNTHSLSLDKKHCARLKESGTRSTRLRMMRERLSGLTSGKRYSISIGSVILKYKIEAPVNEEDFEDTEDVEDGFGGGKKKEDDEEEDPVERE